jgi:hypothetical protein
MSEFIEVQEVEELLVDESISEYELEIHEVYDAGQEFLMERLEMLYGTSADAVADEFGLGFLESLGDDMAVMIEFISDPTSVLF